MKITITLITAVSALFAEASRAEERFVIVQPGYPGTTAEAENFVTDLAGAISEGGGPVDLSGAYYNDEKEALRAIREKEPSFGIVSLGFFLAHKNDLKLEPLLESRPSERFYLAGKKGDAVCLKDLAGQTVTGTPFNEKEFVQRILFGPGAGGGPISPGAAGKDAQKEGAEGKGAPRADGKPLADVDRWKTEAADGFTKAVRAVSRGKARAVLLTEREERGLQDLTAGKELEVFYRTEELPTALVVSVGTKDESARGAAKALQGLKGSPQGKQILDLMGIEGFSQADAKRVKELGDRYRTADRTGAAAGGR